MATIRIRIWSLRNALKSEVNIIWLNSIFGCHLRANFSKREIRDDYLETWNVHWLCALWKKPTNVGALQGTKTANHFQALIRKHRGIYFYVAMWVLNWSLFEVTHTVLAEAPMLLTCIVRISRAVADGLPARAEFSFSEFG